MEIFSASFEKISSQDPCTAKSSVDFLREKDCRLDNKDNNGILSPFICFFYRHSPVAMHWEEKFGPILCTTCQMTGSVKACCRSDRLVPIDGADHSILASTRRPDLGPGLGSRKPRRLYDLKRLFLKQRAVR